jgi:hypothetical protein
VLPKRRGYANVVSGVARTRSKMLMTAGKVVEKFLADGGQKTKVFGTEEAPSCLLVSVSHGGGVL